MKKLWRYIQIRLLGIELGSIKNALFYPKGDKGDYLKVRTSINVAILGLFLTAFFIVALITVFSEINGLSKVFACALILVLSFPFLFLMNLAYKFNERVRKNDSLHEADIWELQNKTQAKLKALTDA